MVLIAYYGPVCEQSNCSWVPSSSSSHPLPFLHGVASLHIPNTASKSNIVTLLVVSIGFRYKLPKLKVLVDRSNHSSSKKFFQITASVLSVLILIENPKSSCLTNLVFKINYRRSFETSTIEDVLILKNIVKQKSYSTLKTTNTFSL